MCLIVLYAAQMKRSIKETKEGLKIINLYSIKLIVLTQNKPCCYSELQFPKKKGTVAVAVIWFVSD